METLRKEKLYAKFKKCEFWLEQVAFLGHVVTSKGITTGPAKVEAIGNWKTPTYINKIRIFLGLVGSYKRFIEEFSRIANPLTKLTWKSKRFQWNNQCEKSF